MHVCKQIHGDISLTNGSTVYTTSTLLFLPMYKHPPQYSLCRWAAISQYQLMDIQAVSICCQSKQQCSEYLPT